MQPKPSKQDLDPVNKIKIFGSQLAFGVLEPLASSWFSVFFPLMLARVACQVAAFFQQWPQFRVVVLECARNTKPYCVSLTGFPATMNQYQSVEFSYRLTDQ